MTRERSKWLAEQPDYNYGSVFWHTRYFDEDLRKFQPVGKRTQHSYCSRLCVANLVPAVRVVTSVHPHASRLL